MCYKYGNANKKVRTLAALISGTRHACGSDNPEQWGCHAASGSRLWAWACDCTNPEECDECDADGLIYPDRCPEHYIDSDDVLLVTLYGDYNSRGVLPFAGGRLDQPHVLFAYFDALRACIKRHEDVKQKRRSENEDARNDLSRGVRNG